MQVFKLGFSKNLVPDLLTQNSVSNLLTGNVASMP
jgi:hypothetical protein